MGSEEIKGTFLVKYGNGVCSSGHTSVDVHSFLEQDASPILLKSLFVWIVILSRRAVAKAV